MNKTDGIKEIERVAMNIVYQIGDALDEKIKQGKDVVTARQETNDLCIDFVANLIQSREKKAVESLKMKTWKDKKDSLPPHIGLIARVRREVVEGNNVIEAFEDGYDQAVDEINRKVEEFLTEYKV